MGDDLWDDVNAELNSGAGGFFNPAKELKVHESGVITITDVTKWKGGNPKYNVKDKAGQPTDYTWRFQLSDGRVWDVSNKNRLILLRCLRHTAQGGVQPTTFRVTNLGASINKQPAVTVALVEDAEGSAEPVVV